MAKETKKALILFSGGQDSTTCLYWAIEEYGKENTKALAFDYGQRHILELEIAEKICKKAGVTLNIQKIEYPKSENSLTCHTLELQGLNTEVVGRNLLFLTYGAIAAKNSGLSHIIIGVSEVDNSGYKDCSGEFLRQAQQIFNLTIDNKIRIIAPFLYLSKSQIWGKAKQLNIFDIIKNETLTCYNGIIADGCGECKACKLRASGERE